MISQHELTHKRNVKILFSEKLRVASRDWRDWKLKGRKRLINGYNVLV
jgi:hypothetical protein